jgi:hypothetical protein
VKLGAVYIDGFNLYHPIHDSGYSEKQSDINVALSLIIDGLEGGV